MAPSESDFEAKFTMESERGGIVDEPPFRILVLGNFSGDAETKTVASRRPVEIDRDNFDEVMTKLGTSVDLDLQGEPITLRFTELEDFHPDRIFAQVPLFADLRDVRRRLKNEDTFYEAAREVRSWFPQTKTVAVETSSTEPSGHGSNEE